MCTSYQFIDINERQTRFIFHSQVFLHSNVRFFFVSCTQSAFFSFAVLPGNFQLNRLYKIRFFFQIFSRQNQRENQICTENFLSLLHQMEIHRNCSNQRNKMASNRRCGRHRNNCICAHVSTSDDTDTTSSYTSKYFFSIRFIPIDSRLITISKRLAPLQSD